MTQMENKPLYIENQYLGRDRIWLSVRLLLALFCFIMFYINIERESESQLFFFVGTLIVIGSVVMMYLLHYRISVLRGALVLSGLWTARLVKIDLNSIVNIEKKPYSTFFINSLVYNLHQKGKIRFYAGGKDAIWLTDRDGLVYVIGTHRQAELYQAITQARKEG